MGITSIREGTGAAGLRADRTVLLIGNPNVGKSTVFNALTGLRRHTGNWTGKTVDSAAGLMKHGGKKYALVDLPGCYSLQPTSPEEECARERITGGGADAAVIVCDATSLERSLNVVLQTLKVTKKAVVCVNLIDEAKKRGIFINREKLENLLGVEVVFTSAASRKGLLELKEAIARAAKKENEVIPPSSVTPMWTEAERIAKAVVLWDSDPVSAKQLKLDRYLTGRITGKLVMLSLLALVFFITMAGANYPSELLKRAFDFLLEKITFLLTAWRLPDAAVRVIAGGGISTLFTVVSVMLPPMAIFFPLFTLLEDLGLLPRIAFNLDRSFSKCGGCGKSALTTCMGFGCNAAGVVGCRIIESPRERLIAILTNSLVPCNGRFPTLTALIGLFLAAGGGMLGALTGALWLTGFILLGVLAVFLVSKLLSVTLLSGRPSSFVLELPPFRKPRIGEILVRSLFDRTVFVLGRAMLTAFPAGLLIGILTETGGLVELVSLLEPFGAVLGVDGAVLTAFLLGSPANELILPLTISIYGGSGLSALAENGWTAFTAVQVMLLMLFHSPCLTTLLTVKKETRSIKMTFAAFMIPVLLGIVLCLITNGIRLLILAL